MKEKGRLIFDIETAGYDFNSLDESRQEFLLRYAQKETDPDVREQKIEDSKRYLSLYPFTAEIISIGMMNTATENIYVLYNGDEETTSFEEGKITYEGCDETTMLKKFWSFATHFNSFVTFNGRLFDAPFLMLRSAILQVNPSFNLVTNKYDSEVHIDLLDKLSFHGTIKKFNLDFYCRSFNIPSPKAGNITGMEIKELYKSGKIKEIAKYCGEDVKATLALYNIWENFLNK